MVYTLREFQPLGEAFCGEPFTVVLSGSYGTGKLGEIPRNFVVRSPVLPIAVLKRASRFITHGGMNSMSEAMVYGVSMVVIPFLSDRPVNAARAAPLGIGRVLRYNDITADSSESGGVCGYGRPRYWRKLKKSSETNRCRTRKCRGSGDHRSIRAEVIRTQQRVACAFDRAGLYWS